MMDLYPNNRRTIAFTKLVDHINEVIIVHPNENDTIHMKFLFTHMANLYEELQEKYQIMHGPMQYFRMISSYFLVCTILIFGS